MDATDPRALLGILAARRGESLAALSRMIRRNDAYLQQFVKRGTPRQLAERDRRLLAAYLHVDEAQLGGPPQAAATPTVSVRRLDIAASAGPGRLVEEDGDPRAAPFSRDLLDALGIRPGSLAMIRAEGDSMAPLIEPGDRIIVDEADRKVGTRGGIYVIRLDATLMVKRLSRSGDQVAIVSDNPSFTPIEPRLARDVEIVGRVVWLSRTLR